MARASHNASLCASPDSFAVRFFNGPLQPGLFDWLWGKYPLNCRADPKGTMTEGPKKLPARYSQKAQEAYGRFLSSNDLSGVAGIVLEAVLDYLPSQVSPEKPRPETPEDLQDDFRLMEDLGFDSLAVAELVDSLRTL